jgi:hypothetical protein
VVFDLFFKVSFTIIITAFTVLVLFIVCTCLGFFKIVVTLDWQKFITLLIIIFVVYLDLCFIASKGFGYLEGGIHGIIILLPFIYLIQVERGKIT